MAKKPKIDPDLIVHGESFFDRTIKSENNKRYPVIVVKLRGRGYSVTDTARDNYSVVSELSVKKAAVFIPAKNRWYKGAAFFGHSRDSGPTVYRPDGIPLLTERQGLLKITRKRTGIEKSRKIPLKAGDSLILVIF